MTEYENKSGTVALRGIQRTTSLDDDGLPEYQWFGANVDEFTARKLIVAILDTVGFRELDKAEQAVIVGMICENVGGRAFQRASVRRIVRGYLRGV